MADEQRHTDEHATLAQDVTRATGRRAADRAVAARAETASHVVEQLTAEANKSDTPLFGPSIDKAFQKFARLGGLWVLIASLVGWVGGRIVSPGEEAADMRAAMGEGFVRQDSLRTALASEIHVRDSVQSSQITDLQLQVRDGNSNARLNGYVLCILARRVDASIVPPECGTVINAYRPSTR